MPNATLSRAIQIYIDGDKWGGLNAALEGKTSTPAGSIPAFMAGDKVSLQIYFRRRASNNGASSACELASGSTIVVAGKSSNALNSADLLWVAGSFTLASTGTDDAYYAGVLELNTTTIAAAFANLAGNIKSIECQMDIECRNATDTERLSYRIPVTLYRQVYDEGVAPSVIASRVTLQDPAGGIWQLTIETDGTLTQTRIA